MSLTEAKKVINRSNTLSLHERKVFREVANQVYAGAQDYAESYADGILLAHRTAPVFLGDIIANDNDVVFSGLGTDGILVGNATSSDYAWEDKEGVIQLRGIGAGEPAWASIGGTTFSGYQWAVGDKCWLDYHVPHDIVPNSEVFFHTHWLCSTTDTTNTCKWQFSISYAKGFGQEAHDLANPVVVTAEQASAGQYYGNVTETAAVDLGITEPDGIIKVVIERITNGATDLGDTVVYMNIADIHYQSTGIGTPNKAPGFYNT